MSFFPKDIFSVAAAGYLTMLALPQLAFPEMALGTWGPEARSESQTATEAVLARTVGVCQLTLALILLVSTGTLPVTADGRKPATQRPVMVIASIYFAIQAAFGMTTANNPPLGGKGHQFTAAALINGGIAMFGFACLLFNTDHHKLNENADRTKPAVGGYPFKSVESEKSK
ncbi:hypothetical protein BC943DRAFT_383390 [Umbelopsis sp. AD052]|nr:hypothetical protein BC943DRAFT_383390 [Umbelopsis sp. AD052]